MPSPVVVRNLLGHAQAVEGLKPEHGHLSLGLEQLPTILRELAAT
jgi:hypothetical protein